jgi:hypothetical protein
LEATIEAMKHAGLEVTDVKNFWLAGNRYFGLNATVHHAETGRTFEVQFPTEKSWVANKLTHDLYEVQRQDKEPPERQVNALLGILRVNRDLGMDAAVPPGLHELFPPKQKRFAECVVADADLWRDYKSWLVDNPELEARDLAWVAGQFGLTMADLLPETTTPGEK